MPAQPTTEKRVEMIVVGNCQVKPGSPNLTIVKSA